jgi:hypothetical protein
MVSKTNSFPISADEYPVADSVVFCAVCGNQGDSEDVSMMRVKIEDSDWPTIWVHSDICFTKWFLK